MEENTLNEIPQNENFEEQISFADKVIGVITTPVDTLTKLAQRQPKTSDWIVPIIIMILLLAISNIVYFYSPNLKAQLQEKQIDAIEKSLNEKIQDGELTPDEAKNQMEMTKKQLENFGSLSIIFQVIGTGIFLFINFFIVNAVFYLLIKYILNGEGNFKSAMSAYGNVYYILILQAIFALLLTLIMDKFVTGLNVFSFTDMEMMSLQGFIFRKLDLFLIWFYALLGISYAKYFKAQDTKPYIVLVFAVWIITNALFYYLSTVSLYFQGLIM